jgi:hypothetical protein
MIPAKLIFMKLLCRALPEQHGSLQASLAGQKIHDTTR